MLTQISGVGKQKIAYKNPKSIQFDSLNDYLLLAKKAVSKFANQAYNGLSKKMLKDEDAISIVANAIMMADWRWDENYQNSKGTKKSKYSYRNQCAIWAIRTYVTQNYKNTRYQEKTGNMYSLDFCPPNEDISYYESIEDKRTEDPAQICINNEEKRDLTNIITNMLNISGISDRQKKYIQLYYFEGLTLEKIGKEFGVTREAVRQSLGKAIDTIRSFI